MSCVSDDLLIICATDYTIMNACRGVYAKRLCLWFTADTAAATTKPLRLRFDRDFGLHRIGNETLFVCSMIHFLDFLCGGLVIARELQSLV
jgi:hypothetical protein